MNIFCISIEFLVRGRYHCGEVARMLPMLATHNIESGGQSSNISTLLKYSLLRGSCCITRLSGIFKIIWDINRKHIAKVNMSFTEVFHSITVVLFWIQNGIENLQKLLVCTPGSHKDCTIVRHDCNKKPNVLLPNKTMLRFWNVIVIVLVCLTFLSLYFIVKL